ncbi:hypothetical protein CLU99_2215 [Flavobacterium sp. 2]|nr:hypothetical protein CLU99_2215 [Flavobacterium sp. 2]
MLLKSINTRQSIIRAQLAAYNFKKHENRT